MFASYQTMIIAKVVVRNANIFLFANLLRLYMNELMNE